MEKNCRTIAKRYGQKGECPREAIKSHEHIFMQNKKNKTFKFQEA